MQEGLDRYQSAYSKGYHTFLASFFSKTFLKNGTNTPLLRSWTFDSLQTHFKAMRISAGQKSDPLIDKNFTYVPWAKQKLNRKGSILSSFLKSFPMWFIVSDFCSKDTPFVTSYLCRKTKVYKNFATRFLQLINQKLIGKINVWIRFS